MRHPLPFLLIATLTAGCPSGAPAPPGPPEPLDVSLGEPVEGTVEVLIEGPIDFADLLPGWRVVAQRGDELLELGPLDTEPTSHGTSTGPISGVEPLTDGSVLIAAEQGLFTLHPWGLAPSPLGEVYTPAGPTQLLAAEGPGGLDLWLADDDGLQLWRDGDLYSIDAGDLPTAGARIAWGSPVQGFGALWIAADESVFALVEQSGGFVTWEEGGQLDALAMTVDGVDDLWTLISGGGDPAWGDAGDLRRRLPDGTWQWFRLAEQPEEIVSGTTAHVWLRSGGESPRLWRTLLDSWADVVVDGAPPIGPEDTLVGADAAGRLLVYGPDGLRRISVERPIIFVEVEDGAALIEPTTLTIIPTLSDRAADMSASLDGTTVALEQVESGEKTAWTLSLDPALLSDGAHEVSVTASWDDGAELVEQSLFFSVGSFDPPTWSGQIARLSDDYCARCHSADGGAHLLDTRARWEDEVEAVLSNVISGAMPISGDKLSSDEIRSIELWRAGGFQE